MEGNLDSCELSVLARTARECDMIEGLLSLSKGASLLDCPCGYGRHSIELASRGYAVTGVDLCPPFIAEAQETLQATHIKGACRFLSGDMRSLPSPIGPFDACVNMFLSFGFFAASENARVLQQFHSVLRPGGKLLIHTDVNPANVERGQYGDREVRHLLNGSALEINESVDAGNRLNGSWTIINSDGSRVSRRYSLRIYSNDEMRTLLLDAGFANIEISGLDAGGLTRSPDTQEVCYVATRK